MSGVSPISLPALLVRNASDHGNEIALRYKHLGIWQVRRWAELAGEVARLAAALQARGLAAGSELVVVSEGRIQALVVSLAAQWLGARVILIDPAGADWSASVRVAPWLYLDSALWLPDAAMNPGAVIYVEGQARGVSFIHYDRLHDGAPDARVQPCGQGGFVFPQEPAQCADITAQLDAARLLVKRAALGPRDEVLMGSRFASHAHLRLVLLPWLVAGLRLNLVETPATRERDRREVAPSVIVGDQQQYARLHARVAARAPLPGSFSHWLYRWALWPDEHPRTVRKALGYWLIRRPLLDVLGLGRVRVALLDGAELAPATAQFFGALGIAPSASHSLPTLHAGVPVRPAGALLASPRR